MEKRLSPRGSSHGRAGRSGRYAVALLVISVVSCLLLPKGIPGQEILAQRFPVFALLSLIVLAGVYWGRGRPRFAPAVGILLCSLHLLLWYGNFRQFNIENADFDQGLFPPRERGAILSGIVYDYRWRGRPAYIHFPGYYITWKKGIAATSVIGYRFGAVRRKAPIAVLPAYKEWIGRVGGYDGRYDHLAYLLVRGDPPAGREWETDEFVERSSAGRWRVLENESLR
jgi:hypothetical protein